MSGLREATLPVSPPPPGETAIFDYVVSGLQVRSEVELPSAIRALQPHAAPDVLIRFGTVPRALPSPDRRGPDWEVQGDRLLLHLQGVMWAEITAGHTILVESEGEYQPRDLVLFLLGTCFAVILQQRGRVVLHASAVAVEGRAMLFCGQSGAGKSTLAALLSKRGFPVLNDDVCNLAVNARGEYVAYPDGRMLKLWSASMQHLQLQGSDTSRVRGDLEKFYAAPQAVDLSARVIGGVYLLQTADGAPELQRLHAADALAALTMNAYRPALVTAMAMLPSYFAAAVGIQRQAGVYRLSRPMDFTRVDAALDLLEEQWAAPRVR